MNSFKIKINREKCNRCGLCVRDCVSGCLLLKDGIPAALNPGWCSLCGHCSAICPKNAIEHTGLKGAAPRQISREKYSPDAYKNIVTTRRSIRRFTDKPVLRKAIEEIINLASFSPTASNTRELGYTVITDRDIIRNIDHAVFKKLDSIMKLLKRPPISFLVAVVNLFSPRNSIRRYLDRQEYFAELFAGGRDLITHGAPVLLLIHGPKKSRFGAENAAIAACNITNFSHAKGLGTCYIGLINVAVDLNKKLLPLFGIPKGRKIYIALIMGYPAHKYQNTAIRPDPAINWVGRE